MIFKNNTGNAVSIKLDGEWKVISENEEVEMAETVAKLNGLTKVTAKVVYLEKPKKNKKKGK